MVYRYKDDSDDWQKEKKRKKNIEFLARREKEKKKLEFLAGHYYPFSGFTTTSYTFPEWGRFADRFRTHVGDFWHL